MQRKSSERGSVLLLELLVVISILGVLLAMTAPSFMQMRMSQQANQALSTLRAIQNAETYYLQIYHNGYVDPGVLAGTGVAVPAVCDALHDRRAGRAGGGLRRPGRLPGDGDF